MARADTRKKDTLQGPSKSTIWRTFPSGRRFIQLRGGTFPGLATSV